MVKYSSGQLIDCIFIITLPMMELRLIFIMMEV